MKREMLSLGEKGYEKLFFILILLLALVTGCVEEKKEEIKIGVLVPKTGEFSSAGLVMENAAKLAEKHAREMGYNVKVIVADCGDKPETAKTAFISLAQQGVVAVVGTYSSPQTLIVADTAKDLKVVFMASVAAAEIESKVREGNKYVFRNAYNATYWGTLAAEFLKSTNASSYYLVGYEPLKTFNMLLFGQVKNMSDAKLVGESWYKSPAISPEDYKDVAAKVAKIDVDVVILGDPGPISVEFVKYYRLNGGKAIVYSVGGTLALPQVLKKINVNDVAFQAAAIENQEKTRITKKYFEDYKATFGEEANNYAGILTYDAVLIIAQAAAKSGDLIENLEKGSFLGAAGVYRFNEAHQAMWGLKELKGSLGIYRNGTIQVLS